jgi:hypothetical protein
MAMTPMEHELLEQKFKGVYQKMDDNNTLILFKLERILEQTTRTNGRVSKIEEERDKEKIERASLGYWLMSNPYRFVIAIIVICTIIKYAPEIFKLF